MRRGKWTNGPREHICRTPHSRWFRSARTGDLWTCRCGQSWRLSIEREPRSAWVTWRWKAVSR